MTDIMAQEAYEVILNKEQHAVPTHQRSIFMPGIMQNIIFNIAFPAGTLLNKSFIFH